MTLAIAFALTVVIEGLIAAAVLRRWVWWDDLIVQLATWPLAIVLWRIVYWLVAVEVLVIIAEVFLWRALRKLAWPRAIALSLLANTASALLGEWLL